MDPIGRCEPLLEAKLELREPDLYYMPSLEPEDPDGLDQLILGLLNDITGMSALVPRLKSDLVGYAEEFASDDDIKGMKDEILTSVATAVEEATDFCSNFEGIHEYFCRTLSSINKLESASRIYAIKISPKNTNP